SAGAARRPPLRGRPIGGRIDVTGGADGYANRIARGVNANWRFISRVCACLPPRNPGVRAFAAPHPGVRTCGPAPGLHSHPPLRGALLGGGSAKAAASRQADWWANSRVAI